MLIIALFAVGCLPKELGDLVNLTVLNVSGNRLTGPLSILVLPFYHLSPQKQI